MKPNKQPKKTDSHPPTKPVPDDPLFNIQQAASMTECTGILPAQVQTEDEGENIAALESIHPIRPPSPGRKKASRP